MPDVPQVPPLTPAQIEFFKQEVPLPLSLSLALLHPPPHSTPHPPHPRATWGPGLELHRARAVRWAGVMFSTGA